MPHRCDHRSRNGPVAHYNSHIYAPCRSSSLPHVVILFLCCSFSSSFVLPCFMLGCCTEVHEASALDTLQISWLVDKDQQLLVRDIIKLEELEAHWPQLQRRICGLSRVQYADGGLRRNPSSHGHYSDYYDDETRQTVVEYMAADVHAFGYSFRTRAEEEEAQKGKVTHRPRP